jgi:hypothetical protein
LKFSDLMSLPFDSFSAKISVDEILKFLPQAPFEVVDQFYSDHGRKEEFQVQYQKLYLPSIEWKRKDVAGRDLLNINIYPSYRQWFDSVGHRAVDFDKLGWAGIDSRFSVQQHWEKFGTWDRHPVLISGSFVNSGADMHLVEGHTRVGLLKGLIEYGISPKNAMHTVWLGTHAK